MIKIPRQTLDTPTPILDQMIMSKSSLHVLHQILVSTQVNEENAEEEIREAFRVFDGDGNGFIDRLFAFLEY